MKISYNWLKDYLITDYTPEQLGVILTACGLEVESIESIESIKGGLKGVIIGEVLEKTKHPDADRLSITKVNIGNGDPLQIVCGASNVATGQKVIVAMVGTTLYPVSGEKFEIKKSKIRGVVSEGMICAEDEIGLGTSHDGIMVLSEHAVIGSSASSYFKLENDYLFEIGLTPNRVDAASHIGVARDIAAVINVKNKTGNQSSSAELKIPSTLSFSPDKLENKIKTEIIDETGCIRYSGVCISGVSVKESPDWLKKRLMTIGLKPINNIVDITNFVLHECGQPLHAFDADKINGNKVLVKKCSPGTKFKTLDNVERTLTGQELMICNAEEPMCMAGIMGGIASGISESAKNIFLESACFHPSVIRNASKHHALKSDSSFRFERGTDPNGNIYALKRAALLIKEIAGGKITSDIIDIYPSLVNTAEVELRLDYLDRITGIRWDKSVVKEILKQLEIKIVLESAESLTVAIPTYKVDVKRPADLSEEILRIYGYDHIPIPSKINSPLPAKKQKDLTELENKLSAFLTGNGFSEILNNSLSKSVYKEKFLNNSELSVPVLNPLSQDLAFMRESMLFSGLETIAYNSNRKNPDLRLFEFGKTYHRKENGFDERNHLSVFLSGNRFAENWQKQEAPNSFYYLKSLAENCIIAVTGKDRKAFSYSEKEDHNSTSFSLIVNTKPVAQLAILKKPVLNYFDISGDVFYADVNLNYLLKLVPAKDPSISEPPKFPEVRRDLSMLLNKEVSYSVIEVLAFQTEKKLLKSVNLFDVYEGNKIEPGKKSYAMSFFLRDEERTLEDKQIDAVMNKLMQAFETKAGAVIRKA